MTPPNNACGASEALPSQAAAALRSRHGLPSLVPSRTSIALWSSAERTHHPRYTRLTERCPPMCSRHATIGCALSSLHPGRDIVGTCERKSLSVLEVAGLFGFACAGPATVFASKALGWIGCTLRSDVMD